MQTRLYVVLFVGGSRIDDPLSDNSGSLHCILPLHMLSRSLFKAKILQHLRWYVMVGSSSPPTVLARSKIGA